MFFINKLLHLPKADLKTKNSSKRRRYASFGWVFGFQLHLLEKHLITLTVLTFTHQSTPSAQGRVEHTQPNDAFTRKKSVPSDCENRVPLKRDKISKVKSEIQINQKESKIDPKRIGLANFLPGE